MLNGVIYKKGDSIPSYPEEQVLVYYAENICGVSTSIDSYFTMCGDKLINTEDSLRAVGGKEEDLSLFRKDELHSLDSILLIVHTRFDPQEILLKSTPQDPARMWLGDEVTLTLVSNYTPSYMWYRVVGDFDGRYGAYDKYGEPFEDPSLHSDEYDYLMGSSKYGNKDSNEFIITPTDTAYYYVLVGDNVCPYVSSNIIRVDVMSKLPTAITPYVKDGMNDDFMKGHEVMIFNRYGQLVFEGNDGWDGTYRGILADPGVYFYDVKMKNGTTIKGSIEIVKLK